MPMNLRNRCLALSVAALLLAGAIATAPATAAPAATAKVATKAAKTTAKVAAKAPAKTPAAQPPLGAIWVSTEGSYYRNTPRIDRFIEDVRAKPFGEVVIQVVDKQTAYYNSKLMPKALGIPAQFDPLATLAAGLHAKPGGGVRLVAWIAPYLAGNINHSDPVAPDHPAQAHPDWLSTRANGAKTDQDGNQYLEPGLPEVQQYLEAVVREIVHNYPVDGIYFDLMGDPGEDWGYHPAALEAWRQKSGGQGTPVATDPSWIAFRAELISQALAGLTQAARSERPTIAVGAGARADGPAPATPEAFVQSAAFMRYHQDWIAWMTGPAAVSRLYLKDFKSEETEKGAFDGWLQFALRAARPSRTAVLAGVAGTMNESVLVLEQLHKALAGGAQGVALADYDKPVRDNDAREPFMNAIRHTILASDFMPMIAGVNPSGAAPQAAESPEPASPQKTAVAMIRPAPPAPKDDLAMPPPPVAVVKVEPASGDTVTSGPITEGSGEVKIKAVRPSADGLVEADTTGTVSGRSTPPRLTPEVSTRRQMLEELLSDPIFSRTNEASLIRPGEQYKAYLKKNFGNIFE